MNIGFVGVGRMGANMARRLKDRGEAEDVADVEISLGRGVAVKEDDDGRSID